MSVTFQLLYLVPNLSAIFYFYLVVVASIVVFKVFHSNRLWRFAIQDVIFYLKIVQSMKIAVLLYLVQYFTRCVKHCMDVTTVYMCFCYTFPYKHSLDEYSTLNLFRGMCNYWSVEALFNRKTNYNIRVAY